MIKHVELIGSTCLIFYFFGMSWDFQPTKLFWSVLSNLQRKRVRNGSGRINTLIHFFRFIVLIVANLEIEVGRDNLFKIIIIIILNYVCRHNSGFVVILDIVRNNEKKWLILLWDCSKSKNVFVVTVFAYHNLKLLLLLF